MSNLERKENSNKINVIKTAKTIGTKRKCVNKT